MRTLFSFLFLALFQIGISQTSSVNAYEYVIVPMEFEFQDEPNQYQLNILSRVLLKEQGFKVYMDTEERPLNYRGNTCEPLFLEIENTSGFLSISLVARLKDCYDNVLFETEEGKSKIKDFKEGYQDALKRAFASFSDLNYLYNKAAEVVSRPKTIPEDDEQLSKAEDTYPNKSSYKFGGETFWLVKNESGYIIYANEGQLIHAELQNADRGSFIYNSKRINGAAFFDAEGNINVEYRDEDLDEIQRLIFRKID